MAIHLRAPGSASNLGPGFDCLGLALTIYNRITVREVSGSGVNITITGEGAGDLEDAVDPAGAEIMLSGGVSQQPLAASVEVDPRIQLGR